LFYYCRTKKLGNVWGIEMELITARTLSLTAIANRKFRSGPRNYRATVHSQSGQIKGFRVLCGGRVLAIVKMTTQEQCAGGIADGKFRSGKIPTYARFQQESNCSMDKPKTRENAPAIIHPLPQGTPVKHVSECCPPNHGHQKRSLN